MPSIEVQILGHKFSIKGEASKEHIRELSNFIDAQIKDIYSKYPNITATNAMILALFNISDELQRLRKTHAELSRRISEKTDILTDLFD